MKKATPNDESSPLNNQTNITPIKSGKLVSMLHRFAEGKEYHRFSAEVVGDHCLPTTISDLQKRHSIYFERKFIQVPNCFGTKTSVKLYWLQDESLVNAQLITGIIKAAA